MAAVTAAAAVASGQTVVLTTDTSVGPTNPSLEGMDVVVEGATLTIDGVHSLRSLTVQRSAANRAGVVTHSPAFANGDGPGFHLRIAGDLIVQGAAGSLVASRIDANRRGFPSSQGPGVALFAGTGVCCGRGGSGHGGPGGAGSTFPGGPA